MSEHSTALCLQGPKAGQLISLNNIYASRLEVPIIESSYTYVKDSIGRARMERDPAIPIHARIFTYKLSRLNGWNFLIPSTVPYEEEFKFILQELTDGYYYAYYHRDSLL